MVTLPKFTNPKRNASAINALRGYLRYGTTSPGENRLRVATQLLDHQRRQELAVAPRPGALVVALRHMPQLGRRLEPLEHQFDLQAGAAPLQNLPGGEGRRL